MDDTPTFDEIGDWIDETEPTMSLPQWAETVVARAATIAVGAEGRAEVLTVAGEALASSEDLTRSLEHFQAAMDDGGWTTIDPRVGVVQVLLSLGRDDDADAVLATARRQVNDVRSEASLSVAMGEVLETAQRWKDAERWYTIGLREFDPDIDEPDADEDLCLFGRYRVRRARGLGADRFDTWVEADAPEWVEELTAGTTALP